MAMYITYIEQGEFNLIVSAQRENASQLPNTKTIEIQDSQVFVTILEALADKKTIRFYSGIQSLTSIDIEIAENDNVVKNSYMFQLYSAISKTFSLIPQYFYYRYSYLNNLFCSKGFFITELNREEVYIKILETEDEFLIEKLEELLKIIDKLNHFEQIYQTYLNAQETLEVTEDENVMANILREAQDAFENAQKSFVALDDRGWFSTIKGKYQNSKIQIKQNDE